MMRFSNTNIKYIKCLAVAMLMILAESVCVTALTIQETDRPNQFVLDLINQYRSAPYVHALSLGYDPLSLAEKGIGPDTSFAPYVMEDTLNAAAADANTQAAGLSEEFLAPVVMDRQHVVQTGSILTFSNFIPVETAGTLFVQNLLKNELDTGDFQYILSSAYKYAGVSMDPGVMDGWNTWFSSLVLGSSARVTDIQLLNLINQVRAEPSLVPLSVSTDFLGLFRQNPQIYQLPDMQFQPVFFNDLLHEFAEIDVLKFHDSDDAGWSDALEFDGIQEGENTYPGGFFDMATASVSWADMADAGVVTDLFSALLVDEFATWPYDAIIFSNYYNEAGAFISVETGEAQQNPEPWKPPMQPGLGTVSYVAGPGAAMPEADLLPEDKTDSARIYGILFTDYDGDYIYAPGDEVPGETVAVYDIFRNPVAFVISDNAGHFSMTLTPGYYWFEAWQADRFVQCFIHVEKNQFLKLGFNPIPLPAPPLP